MHRMNAVTLAACTAAALAVSPVAAQRPEGPARTDRLTLETFLDMELNMNRNDAELPNTFPFLAPPHL